MRVLSSAMPCGTGTRRFRSNALHHRSDHCRQPPPHVVYVPSMFPARSFLSLHVSMLHGYVSSLVSSSVANRLFLKKFAREARERVVRTAVNWGCERVQLA